MKIKGLLAAAAAVVMTSTYVYGANPVVDIIYDSGNYEYGIGCGGISYADVRDGADENIKKTNSAVLLFVNGDIISDADPVIQNGTTLVPLRVISNELGAEISWNDDEKTAYIISGDTEISVKIGDSFVTAGGTEYETTAPAQIIDSLTYVPLRAIAAAFGAEVGFYKDVYFGKYDEIPIVWVQNKEEEPTISEEEAVSMAKNIYFNSFLPTMKNWILAYDQIDVDTVTAENINETLLSRYDHKFNCRCDADLGEYYLVRYYDVMSYGVLIDKYDGSFYPVGGSSAILLHIGAQGTFDYWNLFYQ
ncbi:MAG: copper amine oxidase N-terminal domain-containing protein [Eubacterium sp.]|nr:copper amine oxidase N-terminal domain-containing protein [Eubacterium sp.]